MPMRVGIELLGEGEPVDALIRAFLPVCIVERPIAAGVPLAEETPHLPGGHAREIGGERHEVVEAAALQHAPEFVSHPTTKQRIGRSVDVYCLLHLAHQQRQRGAVLEQGPGAETLFVHSNSLRLVVSSAVRIGADGNPKNFYDRSFKNIFPFIEGFLPEVDPRLRLVVAQQEVLLATGKQSAACGICRAAPAGSSGGNWSFAATKARVWFGSPAWMGGA